MDLLRQLGQDLTRQLAHLPDQPPVEFTRGDMIRALEIGFPTFDDREQLRFMSGGFAEPGEQRPLQVPALEQVQQIGLVAQGYGVRLQFIICSLQMRMRGLGGVDLVGQLAVDDALQAYLIFADGRRTDFPVWFVPWFELEQTTPALREIPDLYYSVGHTEALMQWAGFRRRWPGEVITAAGNMLDQHHREMLAVATTFFSSRAAMVPQGLDQLPECWLAALPGILWKMKKPEWSHLPFFIDRVGRQDGMLLLHFVQEQPQTDGRLTVWDRIRIAVNGSLYPNCWRPLAQRHRKQLCQLHPELRPALTGTTPAIE